MYKSDFDSKTIKKIVKKIVDFFVDTMLFLPSSNKLTYKKIYNYENKER